MAWIESHQTLGQHPKTRKLAHLLGVSKPAAIGHLHCLWWWAIDYAEDGDLARFDPLDIAIGAEWDGDECDFVNAMYKAGFLDAGPDNTYIIHDWDHYAGKLIERKKANAERMRKARAERESGTEKPRADHVQRTQRARVERPNLTVPNQTKPDSTGPSVAAADATDPADEPEETPSSEPKPMPRNGAAQTMLAVLHEDILKIPPPTDYGRAAKKAHDLIRAGCTLNEMQEIAAWMLRDPWHADKGVTIYTLATARDNYHSSKSQPANMTRVSPPSRRTTNASGDDNMTNDELEHFTATGQLPERFRRTA